MSELPSPKPESDDPALDHTSEQASGSALSSAHQGGADRQWEDLFAAVAGGLRAFLKNRLRQDSDVDDCLQVVYVKMLESIQPVAPAARRAWLFRVAANEAARFWRSEASKQRMLQQHGGENRESNDPIDEVILTETSRQIQRSLQRLPPAWQKVVRLRIHQNLTFQQIAERLDIPLGTALTQMRRAMERIKGEIDQDTK